MIGPPRRDEAFEEAFDDLYPRARALATHILGDREAAEDVAAEALARTCLRWRRLEGVPWLAAWVMRVTTNLALDVAKRKRPALTVGHRDDTEETTVLRLTMVEALQALPRRQREVLALRFLSDLSEADVAAALGISAGSVKAHTSRGLAAMRRRLGREMEEVPLAFNGT